MHENKRVYPNGALVSHLLGHVNIDNQGIAGIEKWLDNRGLADLHLAGLARDRLQTAGRARGRSARAACDARRADQGAHQIQGDGRGRPGARRPHRRDRLHGVGARLRPQQPARGARPDPHQPAHHRRVRDGLDLQGPHARDGARFRPDESQLHAGRACSAAIRPHTINDYRGQKRMLSLPEVFTYSSNIGTARMALALGVEHHKQFLRRSASSTGCARSCPRAPSRWFPGAGWRSTP